MWELVDPLVHLNISSSCSNKLKKTNSRGKFSELLWLKGISKYLEALDSIFCSQRFSIEKSFVHFCIFDKSVLQCWSSFSCFKHCKILPIIDQLLILELRSGPTTEWWNFRSDSTCSCSLIFWFCAICTIHRFDVLLSYSAGNIGKSSRSSSKSLIISVVETLNNTHSTETGTLQESYSMESCVRQDPLLVQQPSLRSHFVVVILFSLCKPYVTRIRHWTVIHKTVMILSLLDSILIWQHVSKKVITRIVSMRILFRHNACEWNHTVHWRVGLEPNGHKRIKKGVR